MSDRGEYRKCETCDMYLWEAHSANDERHQCAFCFFNVGPWFDVKTAREDFKKRLRELDEAGVGK